MIHRVNRSKRKLQMIRNNYTIHFWGHDLWIIFYEEDEVHESKLSRANVLDYFIWDCDHYVQMVSNRSHHILEAKILLWKEYNKSLPQVCKSYYFFNRFYKHASKKQIMFFLNNFDVIWC